MSTIKITFQVQALDFAPLTRGQVNVMFNDGTQTYNLYERLTTGTAYSKYFQEVPWQSGLESSLNFGQATNFAQAFNRDYKNVGGTKNLVATVSGNEVTITAQKGTFPTGSEYTGNVLAVGGFTRDNSVQVSDVSVTASRSADQGDCTEIEYSITASGGEGTYTLTIGGVQDITGWDGSARTVSLTRGTPVSIRVDDSGTRNSTVNVIVPRKLAIGEFKERFTQYEDYSDVSIEETTPVAGTSPLEFALVTVGEDPTGQYQSSNNFPGIFPNEYDLWVKDAYGCEITKTIEVRALEDVTEAVQEDVFYIPEGNSLMYHLETAHGGEIRKNYFNTSTRDEKTIGKRYKISQPFFDYHVIPTRIMSSYPFHVCTIRRCDGTKKNVPVITVQENLGSQEKVDCMLFPVSGSIGVYFNGGNEYEPGTDTIIDSSSYTEGTPSWAIEGQLVNIDGIGGKYITGEGFDDDRGYYFTVAGTIAGDTASKVSATFNKHNYNLLDFFISMQDIPVSAQVEIEFGYSFDQIVGKHKSEVIERVADSEIWNLIKWGDSKNKGDMVYQDFPQPFILIKGKMDNIYPSETDTSRGDSKTYLLQADSYLGFSFRTTKCSRKMINKLNIASGTEYFEINGIPLTRNTEASIENFGQTNLKTWACDFDYGGNQLGLRSDESDILDVSTGVVGGGSTAKGGNQVPPLGEQAVYDGKIRYIDSNGNFLTMGGGLLATE